MELTGENVKQCCSWITIEMFYEWEINFYFCTVLRFGGFVQHTLVYADTGVPSELKVWRWINIHLFHNPASFSPTYIHALQPEYCSKEVWLSDSFSALRISFFFFNLPFLGFTYVFYWEEGQSKKKQITQIFTPKIMKDPFRSPILKG